jgi:hypothetical protein
MHYMPSLNNAIFLNSFSTLATSLRNNFIFDKKNNNYGAVLTNF